MAYHRNTSTTGISVGEDGAARSCGYVDGRADGPAGMVQPWRHLRELHEIPDMFQACEPPSPYEVRNQRRLRTPASERCDRRRAERAGSRPRSLNTDGVVGQSPRMPAIKPLPGDLDPGSPIPEPGQRFLVAPGDSMPISAQAFSPPAVRSPQVPRPPGVPVREPCGEAARSVPAGAASRFSPGAGRPAGAGWSPVCKEGISAGSRRSGIVPTAYSGSRNPVRTEAIPSSILREALFRSGGKKLHRK